MVDPRVFPGHSATAGRSFSDLAARLSAVPDNVGDRASEKTTKNDLLRTTETAGVFVVNQLIDVPPGSAPADATAPQANVTLSGDDTAGDGTLQTDDATAGSATLAEVYEELGETDFDALETALRKCDADEEDIAAVHAVLDRAGRKEEVGD